MKQYYAAYNDEGKLTGLYNSVDHKPNQIPAKRIEIPHAKYLEIIVRPNDFTVENGKLRDHLISVSNKIEDTSSVIERWRSGFMYKDVCYWADESSSSHVTQCLAILAHDKEFKPKLKATVSGKITLVDVSAKDLINIAKGINDLRLEK